MVVHAVIADLVGSRRVASRTAVQRALAPAFARVEALVPSVDGLAATVGDEFQGLYSSLADALAATQLLRLVLLPVVDTRYGIGAGERTVVDDTVTPPIQDGTAWWSARAAVDALGSGAGRRRRTWYDGRHAAPGAPDAALVNALLLTRDALTDRLGDRGPAVLLRLLEGATQQEIALAEGVSPSAVSQQVRRGVGAARDAHLLVRRAGSDATDDGVATR
ncbi:SatD family protein [Nocardioides zeae]|uniref:SatD family protein n=1 Tax=Nocardioides imazamoxiresistens TaxID=3231893 RepID=A0ABU3PTW3_9ACTN|nr:SatD family protein [Nocardioides zeae]MDT9592287.1 SatD family protein [Nocardioides zeae]